MGKKLTFHSNLYLSESMKDKKTDKIKKKLIKKPLFAGVYVLAIAQNSEDQLEFFDCKQLTQHYYENDPVYVVGIAKDYNDALKLVEQITQECLAKRGDCKLKEYLIC